MADIYDIAAHIKTPSELRAVALANRNKDLENRIMQRNEDYFKNTGTSPASQANRKLDIEEETAQIDRGRLAVAMGEFHLKANDDERKNLASFEAISQAVYGAQKRGDEEGAKALYDTFVKANKLDQNPDMKDSPLLKYNPQLVEAMATMAQTKDPKAPFNYALPSADGKDLKLGSVDRNDLARMTELTQQGALFDSGANGMLTQLAALHPDILRNVDKNPELLNKYVAKEEDFNAAFHTMDRIETTLDEAQNAPASLGTAGKFVRMADSVLSQVGGLVQMVTDLTGKQNQQRKEAGLPVYGEGVMKDGEVQLQQSIVPSQNPDLYKDTAAQLAAKLRQGPLKNTVRDASVLAYNIMDLEYTIAKLEESGSRNLSDTDIKRRAMLFDVGSPDQLVTAIEEAKGGMANRLAFSRRLQDPTGELYSRIYPGGKGDPLKEMQKARPKPTASTGGATGAPRFTAEQMAIIKKMADGGPSALTEEENKKYEEAVAPTRKKK